MKRRLISSLIVISLALLSGCGISDAKELEKIESSELRKEQSVIQTYEYFADITHDGTAETVEVFLKAKMKKKNR